MKPPGVQPIPVRIEELEGLLEQARPALSAEGYEKLRAAIRTLVYVTELLDQKETTLAALRELLMSGQHRENRPGVAAGRYPDGRADAGLRKHLAEAEARRWAWAQRRRRVSRGTEGSRSARILKDRRRVSGWVWRQGLSAARSRRAGTDQRAGAPGRDRL